ncbi:helix-turn-helix domain-containing protein [Streptomyces globisporus]|uniref:AfsR/SARP family transcriptional regulator n=1 Tax=Streptomyces globisporus TaxID=1908 RepID=UPI00345FC572
MDSSCVLPVPGTASVPARRSCTVLRTSRSRASKALSGIVAVPLTKTRERTALALLALNRGQRISKEHLLQAVWGERLPSTVNSQVSIIMYNLRACLAAGKSDVIVSAGGSYTLLDEACDTDLAFAESQIRQARAAAPVPAAVTAWRQVWSTTSRSRKKNPSQVAHHETLRSASSSSFGRPSLR